MFWSYGIDEIKKAFTMYALGKLSIKPIPNHCDIILVGQIFKEYQQQKPKRKKVIEENTISDQEKKRIDNDIVIKSLNYFITERVVDLDRIYVYDILYDDWLPKDTEYKKKVYKDAVECLKIEYSRKKPTSIDEKREIKNKLKDLLKPKEGEAIVKSKEIVLSKFFRDLTKDKEKLMQFKLKYNK